MRRIKNWIGMAFLPLLTFLIFFIITKGYQFVNFIRLS